MVKIELDSRWITKAQCPLRAEIFAAEPFEETFKGRKYTSIRLFLKSDLGEVYAYEVKFGDKNFCVNTFGPDTTDWLGQMVVIALDPETQYKRITLP